MSCTALNWSAHILSENEGPMLVIALLLGVLFLVACGPDLREEIRVACEQEAREQISLPWLQRPLLADCMRRHSTTVVASPPR